MKTKLKICSVCLVPSVLWKSSPKLCKGCAGKIAAQEAIKNSEGGYKQVTLLQTSDGKVAKPFKYQTRAIKSVSTRQQKLNAAYKILRDQFMKEHKICEAGLDGCTIHATETHHKKGRGEFMLDDSTYLALCNGCHRFITEHPAFALEMGFSQSRLSKTA